MALKVSAISLLLFSCSPQKRLNRLVKKHPELLVDSIIHDTTFIKESSIDTVTKIVRNDTVTIIERTIPGERPKPIIKYFYNSHTDSIHIRGECPPDTITKKITVKRYKVINQVKKGGLFDMIRDYFTLFLLLIVLFFVWRLTKK